MSGRRQRPLDIALILFCVMVVEFALNRLAVPALRPANQAPDLWHQGLDHAALFVFHFASVLALTAVGATLWQLLRRRDDPQALTYALVGSGGVFLIAALWTVVHSPNIEVQFVLQGAFTLTVILLGAAQAVRQGDRWTKLGVAVISVPLVAQFYAPFVLRVLHGADLTMYPNIEDASLPERARDVGQASLVVAALLAPLLLAPRPLRTALTRPAPLVVGLLFGLVGALIIGQEYEVGLELAMKGLGVDIGPPGAPGMVVILYLLALTAVTWVIVSCFLSEAQARRAIGIGLALVAIGGYSFSWPLQYMVALIGVFTISNASLVVAEQERALGEPHPLFTSPPIDRAAWQRYVSVVASALGDGAAVAMTAPALAANNRAEPDEDSSIEVTRIVGRRRGAAFAVQVSQVASCIHTIDIQLGGPRPDARPSWTLQARPERVLAVGAHPEPPATAAAVQKTGDAPFDGRFRIRGAADLSGALFDDGLRARATALVDGWLAYWPKVTLWYRVHPGRGAPVDHPIPISELAFRGSDAPTSPDRLIALIDLLCDVASRVGLTAPAANAASEPRAGSRPPTGPDSA
jgi:hypothetical protein